MKSRFKTAALTPALLCFGLLCRAENGPELKSAFVDPSAPEALSYRTAGSYAIDRLVMTMITDCTSAVGNKTEVSALPTFHLKDVPVKNGTVAGMSRITAMKLTSLKLRNPKNAPDDAEKQALYKVQADLDAGAPPRVLVQKVEFPDGKTEWRVYKPLANVRQCGACHARPEQQSPELRAALLEKYPEDQSSVYVTGEWRGLIRVTVADPPPPPKK